MKGLILVALILLGEAAFLFHAALPMGIPARATPAAPAPFARRRAAPAAAPATVPAAAAAPPAADGGCAPSSSC